MEHSPGAAIRKPGSQQPEDRGASVGRGGADDIRRHIDRERLPRYESDTNCDRTEGLFVLPREGWQQTLVRAFTCDSYRADPNYVRVLAYTNRRVKSLNRAVRRAIYGDNLEQFVCGERLIANNPCLEDGAIILQTSEECEVVEISPGKIEGLPVWQLTVYTDEGKFQDLNVLQEVSIPEYERRSRDYATNKQWEIFWEFRQRFHEVNYAYSLTVHKSQGSTFKDVFIDLPDLMRNPKTVERNQLCYVAFTRAAKRVFIY